MRHVLSDQALAADLRARGLQRAQQFSWERTARETLAVYKDVLQNTK
jgi:glycosyltransferase involved in cell wall biosynthesis